MPPLLAAEHISGPLAAVFAARASVALPAAGWQELIFIVVAIGIWAIQQLAGAKKPAPPARRNPPPRPGQPVGPQAGGPPGGGQAAGGQRGLLDEVEQFLKDARKQMEAQQQRPQQQQRPAPSRPIAPPPVPQQRKPKQPKPKRPQPARPLAETRPLGESRPVDDDRATTVDDHVREHLGTDRFDTSRFDERAGKLSSLQQTIEQDIGAHVRSVFDHQVGTMTTGSALSSAAEAPVGPTPAQQLMALLRDPQHVRNAVLLQEVLRPPVERW